MAEWGIKGTLDSSTINGGRRYEDNDGVTTDAINTMFETLFFMYSKLNNITADATTVSDVLPAMVRVDNQGTLLNFHFSIPQGIQGKPGPTGPQGPKGDKSAIFTLNGNVLTITSNTD